ncbi:aminopeptidase [Desulfuribacillus stibiiarsenatis]|uniref:Aminopeptidase n=1 Tax=Desulfuribacillus stibiiarsenatis TaxID=1390249 RepID=A0A1E5L786_9FIRM|nr:M42 family metallopeptidase [Desulfuribacillus stibiiarsenatis]OEH85918.1 aminopeptidase [Desulfuribacillus stibiiarsenatis]
MKTKDLLKRITELTGVSGYEHQVQKFVIEELHKYTTDIKTDVLGNVIAMIPGEGTGKKPSVMVAAHADEIGFMITKIEKGGFVRVTSVGGIDPRTVIAQEVIVHGKEDLLGIFGAKPPHLLSPDDSKKAIPLDELFIDLGMTEEQVKALVRIGDTATIKRSTTSLLGKHISGKAMDDRAGLVVLFEMLKELKKIRFQCDVYFVSTIQEEVGVRGAMTSTYGIVPDVGIAVDVCHGEMPGVPSDVAFELGKGPVIAYGPNIHNKVYHVLVNAAKEENIPYQIEVSQGPTGTDARAMQITRSGVATGLLSIPLRYMHTSVETLSLKDVSNGGKLLAKTIQRIDSSFVEGLTCY